MVRHVSLSNIPDLLGAEDFWEFFGKIEHEELDFKRGVSPCLAATGSQPQNASPW